MRLSILLNLETPGLEAAPPLAAERRAVSAVHLPPCRHRAPAFPLATFVAQLAAAYLSHPQIRTPRSDAGEASGAYHLPAARHRPLLNRSV